MTKHTISVIAPGVNYRTEVLASHCQIGNGVFHFYDRVQGEVRTVAAYPICMTILESEEILPDPPSRGVLPSFGIKTINEEVKITS